MSGGHFDYAYFRTQQFSEDLKYELDNAGKMNEHEHITEIYSPEVVEKLEQVRVLSEKTAKYMKAVEWLYSGDYSEESFMEEFERIENE